MKDRLVVPFVMRAYNMSASQHDLPSGVLGLSPKPKILFVCDPDECRELRVQFAPTFDLEFVRNPLRAVAELSRHPYAGVFVSQSHFEDAIRLGKSLQNDRVLDSMPDGVALLNTDNTVSWANSTFLRWSGRDNIIGEGFYSALGNPEILGPDFCPFHTAVASGAPSSTTIKVGENQFFQLHVSPLNDDDGVPINLLVTVRDVTHDVLQQQKLAAIHRAGVALADIKPDDVFQLGVDERIEILKSNILHYTQDLLKFDVVEIRLINEETGELMPLMAVGMDNAAENRQLFARPKDNGVTGFVAATGKSYLCEDTQEDPLYIQGFAGAKSSLTVPLLLHEKVIGTFNVESPKPRGFTDADLQFLEIFARDIAVALNTLELMVAQKACSAQESVEAIHGAVALPIDEILNDAVNIMERYIGHEPDVVQRLHRVLKNARDIKQVIQKVGQRMSPAEAVPHGVKLDRRPKLRNKRVLVVDADESVRNDAHALLERYGCVVETAHEGGEAIFMVRNCGSEAAYDVLLADIRLPDVNGYELMVRLQPLLDPLPLVLMTGFGYDPGHSIVKARQAGLHPKAILYKPFRLDQLLEVVETILDARCRVVQA